MIFRRNSLIHEDEPRSDTWMLMLVAVAASIIGLILFSREPEDVKTMLQHERIDMTPEPLPKRVRFNPVVTVTEIEPMRRDEFPDYFGTG
jgi:hypothetical protein